MIVSIVSGTSRESVGEFARQLTQTLETHGVEVNNAGPADMILAVGGDGTMLGAVKMAIELDVPVLGFNLGTLGFLTEADPGKVVPVVERLVSGDYEIDERMTLAASTPYGEASGINDVVIEKVDSTRVVTLAVAIDNEPFATYSADGIVVASPTGSTGYAFSAGGPIVDTSLDAMILTPVATHSLFDRPLVLPAETTMDITVQRDRPVRVYVDKTDLGHLVEGESVSVRRGPRDARFVTFADTSYSGLVRDKFGLS